MIQNDYRNNISYVLEDDRLWSDGALFQKSLSAVCLAHFGTPFLGLLLSQMEFPSGRTAKDIIINHCMPPNITY